MNPNPKPKCSNTHSMLKTANRAMRDGHYDEALVAYGKFQRDHPELARIVEPNVQLCTTRLGQIAPTRSGSPVNQCFDEVYVVNLDRSVQERMKVLHQLTQLGIRSLPWRATDGYQDEGREIHESILERGLGQLTRFPEFNEMERKRGKPFIESPGAVGYILTYSRILDDALSKGLRKILILEDDVVLCREFNARFLALVARIDPDWRVLQLGASQYDWSSVDQDEARRLGHYEPRRLHTCGSFAIALDSSVFEELRSAIGSYEAPFDHLPLGSIYEKHRGRCFVAYPNIVVPDVRASTIRGPRDQFAHATKMRWEMSQFVFPAARPTVAFVSPDPDALRHVGNLSDAFDASVDARFFVDSADGPRPFHGSLPTSWKHVGYRDDARAGISRGTSLTDIGSDLGADYVVPVPGHMPLAESEFLAALERKCFTVQRDGRGGATGADPVKARRPVPGRVSVIIPTYRRSDSLGSSIRSVAEQDYRDVEIIVVNDNGKGYEYNADIAATVDATRRIRPELRVRYIEHSVNRNGSAARNTGLFASSGEYVCFLDDDDMYLPGRIARSVEVLRDAPREVAAVYTGYLGWNSPVLDHERFPEGDLSELLLGLAYSKHYVHTNTVTYKRSALLALNGFDESYSRHQDLELNVRYFRRFRMKPVRLPGARLKPEPTGVDNRLFNRDFFLLKQKFLGQFRADIARLGEEAASRIYAAHWGEVVRYAKDRTAVAKWIDSDFTNGALFVRRQLALT